MAAQPFASSSPFLRDARVKLDQGRARLEMDIQSALKEHADLVAQIASIDALLAEQEPKP